MIDCVTQYKKTLKKNLHCSGNVKGRLLNKFHSSLAAFLEEAPTPSMDELCVAFGSPKEMAAVLMEEVTAEETARYRRKNMIIRVAIGFLAIALIVGAVYVYFYKEVPVEQTNDGMFVDELTTSGDGISIEDQIIVED